VATYAPVRFALRWNERALAPLERALAATPAWLLAVAALLALQLALIATHEPWRDEYQALQIAVQSPDMAGLLQSLRYEGHPPLWFLVLRALAHVVQPLAALPLAAGVLAIAGQLTILLGAPFTRAERLLLAASEFFLFEYFTLSRSLTLGVCLLLLSVALWRSRWFWLALALLPFTDFLFGVLSLALLALRWRERTVWWPGVALWAAVGAVAAWTVIPMPDTMPATAHLGVLHESVNWLNRLGVLLLPLQWNGAPQWDSLQPFLLVPFTWAGVLLFFWRQTEGDRLHRALLMGFVALTGLFSAFVYPLAIRHISLAVVLLIVLAWRRAADGAPLRAGLRLWLMLAALCGLLTAAVNFIEPFDTSPQLVRLIRERGLAHENWMAFPASRGQTVSALAGIPFERPQAGCLQTFIRWNARADFSTLPQFEAFLREQIRTHGRFYLLSHIEFADMDPSLIRRVASVDEGYDGQDFNIYVVGPGSVHRTLHLQPCVPGLRPFAKF
jgi:hypothetical protein